MYSKSLEGTFRLEFIVKEEMTMGPNGKRGTNPIKTVEIREDQTDDEENDETVSPVK